MAEAIGKWEGLILREPEAANDRSGRQPHHAATNDPARHRIRGRGATVSVSKGSAARQPDPDRPQRIGKVPNATRWGGDGFDRALRPEAVAYVPT